MIVAGAVSALVTSAQQTSTTALLAEAAVWRGMEVVTLTGADVVARLAGQAVAWYGGPITADQAAGPLGLGLLEPADRWLAELPWEFTGRRLRATMLSEAWALTRPMFVKQPSEKTLPAAAYPDGARLPRTGPGIGPDTLVLVSDVVTFAAEYRLFALEGQVTAGSRYAVYGRLDVAPLAGDRHEQAVRAFAGRLLAECGGSLPSAAVVDVGLIQDPDTGEERWAVVEANMPWFAHCYAADPDRVLDVVIRSAGPIGQCSERDRAFLRPAAIVVN